MKTKNYEKKELIIFLIIILFILEIIGGGVLYRYKVYEYKKLNGIISGNNLVTLIITKKDKKILQKNSKVYLNNKLLKYTLVEDKGVILKRDNKKYYEILINISTPKNKKENDVLELSVKTKKIRIIDLLKKIWEGG